jgi:hypothetical protein
MHGRTKADGFRVLLTIPLDGTGLFGRDARIRFTASPIPRGMERQNTSAKRAAQEQELVEVLKGIVF